MRAWFFKRLLTLLEKHTPEFVRSIQIQILLNATTSAFGRPEKRVWHLPGDRALAAYTAFTKECMSEPAADRRRVYRCAYMLGRKVRNITGFSAERDRERLVIWLYGNIGIRMMGHLPGEIVIPSCYFGQFYTPAQCRTMSLMDQGIISGICGGGKLIFTKRITQGYSRCAACLLQKKAAEPGRDGK